MAGRVSVGALYRELRTMERAGLVEAARTEKAGHRPERTVCQITGEGQLELTTLREQAIRQQAIRQPDFGPNPLGVALTFAAAGVEREPLRRTLRARRDMLAIRIAEVIADRDQLVAERQIDLLGAAGIQRGIRPAEAEIRWHDGLDAQLATEASAAGTHDGT